MSGACVARWLACLLGGSSLAVLKRRYVLAQGAGAVEGLPASCLFRFVLSYRFSSDPRPACIGTKHSS